MLSRDRRADLPLVSIVTPSLNKGNFITETIESVLTQSYPRIEYWIVDGGSTDGTQDILRRYEDRLRWISELDAGQSAAINKGWQRTEGEIIAWLNADDLYFPDAVGKAVDFLGAHPEVEAVYGDCDYIDAQGRFLQSYPTRPFDYRELVRSGVNFIPQPATFIRRRALEAVGFLDETLEYVMDFDYWLRLGLRHSIGYLPCKLAALRLYSDAKSIRSGVHFGSELVQVYQRLFAQPDLPGAVRAIESQALSNAYYRAARDCFWAGDLPAARRYVITALRYDPRNLKRSLFLILGLGSLGRMGLKTARRLRKISRSSGEGGPPLLDDPGSIQ